MPRGQHAPPPLMNNSPRFDWTQGPRWSMGLPGQQRLAGRAGRRWLIVAALSAVAATMSVLAFAGVAAKGATLYPCAGAPADDPQTMYPEKRIYLEHQAWWTPMPGHTMDEPFQDRTGHIHVGMCVPLYQTVSGGKLHLDMKWQEHMMQGVNGQGAPSPLSFIVYIEGLYDGVNLRNIGLWPGNTCTTMQCDGWVSLDWDYSKAPSGWGNFDPFIQEFFADGRELRGLTHWPVNFATSNPPAPEPAPAVLAPDAYTGGESWFTQESGGSAYARAMISRPELSKLWNVDTGQLVPKSGVFHVTVSGEKDGARALIDPKLHNMPPILGTVVMDNPPATGAPTYKSYDLSIDTTKLTDGVHRLFVQNIFKRPSGEQSGVIVLPFLVANGTPPATTTTTTTTPPPTTTTPPPTSTTTTKPTTTTTTKPTTTTTTTPPPPTSTTTTTPPPTTTTTTTPPKHGNGKCKPRCNAKLSVQRQLAQARAANDRLRREVQRLRKALAKHTHP
jgi:hypothetical protein